MNYVFRPEFFLFFVLQTLPKLKKKDFFSQFYVCMIRLMPVQYWSSIMFFRFVFSTAARLIQFTPVTAPGEVLPF